MPATKRDSKNKIELKSFCATISAGSQPAPDCCIEKLPQVRAIDSTHIFINFSAIKTDVKNIVQDELQRMLDTPELSHLIIE